MRILTCLHTMEVGGSQINGIELAGRMAALGHEAGMYADEAYRGHLLGGLLTATRHGRQRLPD